MKLVVFSSKPYDKKYLEAANVSRPASDKVDIVYRDFALREDTAFLANGSDAVCVFVNDDVSYPVVAALAREGVKAILLRCAGYNNVDLQAAEDHGILVAHVPSYSPEAVAEFAVALLQTLNRKTHRAYSRIREGNFSLDGLLGRTLYGKTVGLIGTGRIGVAMGRIIKGFGCRVIAYDPFPSPAFNGIGEYVSLDELLPQSDIVSLHCPLMDSTRHIIDRTTISKMKPGVMLVNTSRGGLIDTEDLVQALKANKLGGVALDVYEGEGSLFYDDHSAEIIQDDILMRLTTFHNAIICGHQAFFTEEALKEIADCTLCNLNEYCTDGICTNSLTKGLTKHAKKQRRDSLPVWNV